MRQEGVEVRTMLGQGESGGDQVEGEVGQDSRMEHMELMILLQEGLVV